MRTVLIWAGILAAAALALQWLECQYLARAFSQEIYIGLIGAAFAGGGVWVGWRLSVRARPAEFERNGAALASLGLTGQEVRVLEQLAGGRSNKEIARAMGLSPNTIKTHLANLYAKLSVSRRTQAVSLARDLGLVP